MGKGDWKRPSSLSKEEEARRWEEAFGPRQVPNVMSDEDRRVMEEEKARLVKELEE